MHACSPFIDFHIYIYRLKTAYMPYKTISFLRNIVSYPVIFSLFIFSACTNKENNTNQQEAIFAFDDNASTRWSSPENRNGIKGAGGKENNGAKGHAYDAIKAGESYTLLETDGPGIINRIWITINDRSPLMLRSLRLNMYWDGESK